MKCCWWKLKIILETFLRRLKIVLCMGINKIVFMKEGIIIKGSFPRTRGLVKIAETIPGCISFGDKVIISSGKNWNTVGLGIYTSIKSIDGGVIEIGSNIGMSNVAIISREKIVIEDNVMLGSGVIIYDNDFHSIDYNERIVEGDKKVQTAPVTIMEGAFLGAGSMVLKGVTIGRHSVIGAKSVVTKSVPNGELWAGQPARFVKKLE